MKLVSWIALSFLWLSSRRRLSDLKLKESPDQRLAPPHLLGRPKEKGGIPKSWGIHSSIGGIPSNRKKEDNWREWKGSGRWSNRRFFFTKWIECFGGTSSQVGRRFSQTGLTFLVSSRQRLQWRNGALLKLLLSVLLAVGERSYNQYPIQSLRCIWVKKATGPVSCGTNL